MAPWRGIYSRLISFLRPVQLCGEERWRDRFAVLLCWGIKHGYGGLASPMGVAVFVDVNSFRVNVYCMGV